MPNFRPALADQKRRYSRLLTLRRLGVADSGRRSVRDNSEPWAKELRSLREAIVIANQVESLSDEVEGRG